MLQSAKLITEEQMHGLHDYVQSIYVLGIKKYLFDNALICRWLYKKVVSSSWI